MAILLTSSEIQSYLADLTDWVIEDNSIKTTLTFKNFIEAVNYINRVVAPAEAAGHHPDLFISYNRVLCLQFLSAIN